MFDAVFATSHFNFICSWNSFTICTWRFSDVLYDTLTVLESRILFFGLPRQATIFIYNGPIFFCSRRALGFLLPYWIFARKYLLPFFPTSIFKGKLDLKWHRPETSYHTVQINPRSAALYGKTQCHDSKSKLSQQNQPSWTRQRKSLICWIHGERISCCQLLRWAD